MQKQLSPEETRATGVTKVVPTDDRHIAIDPAVRSGKPHIVGRRIAVADIANWHLKQNLSIDTIVDTYHLSRAQVYAALAYYYDYQAEIDEREAIEISQAKILQESSPSKLPTKLNNCD